MYRGLLQSLLFVGLLLWASSCDPKSASNNQRQSTTFSKIAAKDSGLHFENTITENDSLSYFKFPYLYMGGGVAIGDINNDGLSDVFLTGNLEENKLYLNQGDFQFKDISKSANTQGDDRWYTGVTMIDINNDGWLDIYLSVSGKYQTTKNQLLINNGDLTFTEKAADYGIDDASNSIQSTFFDYDQDGDLDLFIANYPLVGLSQGNMFYQEKMKENLPSESGHLFRNDGNEHFTDVTQAAGIQNFGLTLGLIASDFNEDGLTDLYLSNDFNVPDYFYLNQGDGTFREVLQAATGHTSMFGMGIDAADFNNDQHLDLIQADMSPEDYVRARVNMASMSPRAFYEGVDMGFHYQYMQNSLQINRGIDEKGLPILSEVSRLAGVASTDWSWSTLFADLDNDGWKDIYITNGMKRDVNDNDVNSRAGATTFKQAFDLDITDYQSQPIANYAYQNQGNYKFVNKASVWNLDFAGFSNGMSYGDLDNDGDLDLVINNIDQAAGLFRNETSGQHYLRVALKGPQKNPLGLGTKVSLKTDQLAQSQELTLSRGFQSSVEPILHFGLGQVEQLHSLTILWPDGKTQTIEQPTVDRQIEVNYALADYGISSEPEAMLVFQDITASSGIDFKHQEDLFDDYQFEPLLPYRYSKMGPALAKADVNEDGLEDFYIGNAKGASTLYLQNQDGSFTAIDGPWIEDAAQEDAGAVFYDFDQDGDQDLYVASHGSAFQDLSDRLYLNLGNANFAKSSATLPAISVASQAIAVGDFNQDSQPDLFIGGRNIPGKYPFPADSYVLKNIGGTDELLRFELAASELTQGLKELGMVTDATWADVDQDGWEDLIVSGEWMPLTIFKNKEGRLENQTQEMGLQGTEGWWYSLETLDVDNDGDLDLIAGNLGLNYKYKSTTESPFEVYATDFDENGQNDIVLSYQKAEKQVPLRGRECSSQQVPAIAKRYKTYREFAQADLSDIYGASVLESALHYQAYTFAHTWFENEGGQYTKKHVLPIEAQFSSINAIEPFDYNGDAFPDLLIAGNLYQAEVETPRADAGIGLVLIGSANGFTVVPTKESGLICRGDVKSIQSIKLAKGQKGFLFGITEQAPKLLLQHTISKQQDI